jgi:predicted metal-binding protein
VCITCKANQPCEDGEQRPGHKVYEAIERLIETDDAGARIELRPVSCLAACERGCAATIFMPGKFGYLLGGLTPDLAADVLAYAGAYAASVTGVVLPSRRAASLRHAILGRFPPQDTQTPDQQPKAAP